MNITFQDILRCYSKSYILASSSHRFCSVTHSVAPEVMAQHREAPQNAKMLPEARATPLSAIQTSQSCRLRRKKTRLSELKQFQHACICIYIYKYHIILQYAIYIYVYHIFYLYIQWFVPAEKLMDIRFEKHWYQYLSCSCGCLMLLLLILASVCRWRSQLAARVVTKSWIKETKLSERTWPLWKGNSRKRFFKRPKGMMGFFQ